MCLRQRVDYRFNIVRNLHRYLRKVPSFLYRPGENIRRPGKGRKVQETIGKISEQSPEIVVGNVGGVGNVQFEQAKPSLTWRSDQSFRTIQTNQ